MNAARKVKRGPAYQLYADRALGSGKLGRLSWAQQGMFYWVLNRAWVDGGVPKDPKVLSRMMPGGPKPSELAPVLELFTAPGQGEGEVTHAMHTEQQERCAELSAKKREAAEKRWHGDAPAPAQEHAPAHAGASTVHQKGDANGMPSQPLKLSIGVNTSSETTHLSTQGGAQESSERGDGPCNEWEVRELAAAPVRDWPARLRAAWLRWLRHLVQTRRFRPSTETLRKHQQTLRELPSDEVRVAWLETAIERGLWAPAEPRNGPKKTEAIYRKPKGDNDFQGM